MHTAYDLKIALVTLTFTLFTGVVRSDDRRTDTIHLTVMTLNAEFLWDGEEPEEGQVNFTWKGSSTEAREHMQAVAQIIIQHDPDIVNLVEVENIEALTTFNNEFLSGRGYKPFLDKGKDTFTGQDVAMLTRIDPEELKHDNRKGVRGGLRKSVSKNYVAELKLGDENIAIISVHLLAIPTRQDRRQKREAQADAIRSIVMEKMDDGFEIILLGDFNDYDGAADSLDHIDSTPITHVLKMIRALDASDPDDDLINVALHVPKANRYTAFYDANRNGEVNPPHEFTSIDHILVSDGLADRIDFVEIPHNHDPRLVTDHFAVVVRFNFGGTTPPPPPGTVVVRIKSLLPNPAGDEDVDEEATIINLGPGPVDLSGWTLRDRVNTTWSLSSLGTLSASDEKTIKRNGQRMAMNNRGDTIELIDPHGTVVHTVPYGSVDECEVVIGFADGP